MASSVDQVFELITKNVAADPGLVKRVGGVYHFDIDGKVWTVDLKNGNGSVKSGKDGKADCTITIKGDDFLSLASGMYIKDISRPFLWRYAYGSICWCVVRRQAQWPNRVHAGQA
jgi:hypothetical protein